MIEVFIGTRNYPETDVRHYLQQAVLCAWVNLGVEARPAVCRPSERWICAEKEAADDYILADDDCLPLPSFNALAGKSFLQNNPDIAIVGAAEQSWPQDAGKSWESNILGFVGSHAVGGIRWIRKGVLKFPAGFRGDDTEVERIINARGKKSGYLKAFKFNHLGAGYSTEWWKQ